MKKKMSPVQQSFYMLMVMLIAGCRAYDVPEPGPMHPANPDAPQAVAVGLSDVLAIDENEVPTMPVEMKKAMGHGGQNSMTGMDMQEGQEGDSAR